MQTTLIHSYKMVEFIMDTADKAVSARSVFNRFNVNIPKEFDVHKEVAQFIFDIMCEFIKFANDTTEMDIYFLNNLLDQSWLDIKLTKSEVQRYIDRAYSEKGFIAKRKAPFFLILIKLYDDEFQSEFYEKMFQSIESIRDDYLRVINSYYSIYEMNRFLYSYFHVVKESVESFLSGRKQNRQENQKENTEQRNKNGQYYYWSSSTVNRSNTTNGMPEGFDEMFEAVLKDFDKYFDNDGNESTTNRKSNQNNSESKKERMWEQSNESETSNGSEGNSSSESKGKAQQTQYSIYDIDAHNKTVHSFSNEQRKQNRKSAIQFLWIVPLTFGIIFSATMQIVPAIISGVALIIFGYIAALRKKSQCPNCGRHAAMSVIVKDVVDRERDIKRKTITENNPIRDARGRISSYITTNRQVTVDVENITYYVIWECKYCKFRKDGRVVETHEL